VKFAIALCAAICFTIQAIHDVLEAVRGKTPRPPH
jgi:hypothetical protein